MLGNETLPVVSELAEFEGADQDVDEEPALATGSELAIDSPSRPWASRSHGAFPCPQLPARSMTTWAVW